MGGPSRDTVQIEDQERQAAHGEEGCGHRSTEPDPEQAMRLVASIKRKRRLGLEMTLRPRGRPRLGTAKV